MPRTSLCHSEIQLKSTLVCEFFSLLAPKNMAVPQAVSRPSERGLGGEERITAG